VIAPGEVDAMERTPLYGGIEAGGSKFVCAVGTGPGDVRAEVRFPTTTPEATIGRAIDFLIGQEAAHGPLSAVGVASFGPLDPSPESPTYGFITTTPKPGWAHADFVGRLRARLACPIAFDTDVNAAALAEWRWGAGRGLGVLVYLTVGTGIGGGIAVNGRPLHGLVHPEMGHARPPRDPADRFAGVCPYHGDCLEGLSSGPAIERRWGAKAEDLPDDHPAWAMEAGYLAWEAANLACTVSPHRIVLGGGVMERASLFPRVRARTRELLAGYIRSPRIMGDIDGYIVPPALGSRAGVLGAIALAIGTAESGRTTP
jgi:fructokinase